MAKNSRQIAFEILYRIQKDSSYSNLALDTALDDSELSQVDKAFTSALVYGVIERLITLDYEISKYLRQPLRKLKPQVLTILRLGAYQILFMDKIPDSAAINEAVKLTKTNSASFASGLVNAVLRKVSANGLTDTKDLSVKFSAPEWLCNLWIDAYGAQNAEKLLAETFGSVDTAIRVNTLRTDCDSLISMLDKEGINAIKSDMTDDTLLIRKSGAIHKTQSYSDGLFHVQDTSSQLCCKALDVKENDTVIDICAAPGGKSFTLAQMMNNSGILYSCDIYRHRLKLISNGAERLGISNIITVENDATVFNNNLPKADKILCDVPCAGLGVIRKKPEIRYKDADEIASLPEIQYSILSISSEYLKVGGTLVYSTCSLNPDENENIIKRFLDENPAFESVKVLPEIKRHDDSKTDYISLMPHIHGCDGFFISAVRKIKDV